MVFRQRWISETTGFWLKVALASWILGSLLNGLLMVIGANLPLGGRLAYSTGERITIMDTDRRLKGSLSPAYRPYENFYGWDRQGNFAFLSNRDGNTEVYIWDGLNYTNISQHLFNDWRPAMNPDGRVAFASERDGNMEIYVWDRSQLTNVSQNPATDDYPAWSEDGRLAWVSNRDGENEIYVWDGTQAHNVSNNPTNGETLPAWSNDGRLAWFTNSSSNLYIWVWDHDHVFDVGYYVESGHLAWSADGKLAYESMAEIYVWDGRDTINVSQGRNDDYNPTWSPDNRLVFVSVRGAHPDLYLWDGASVVQLTNDRTSESAPVWMP